LRDVELLKLAEPEPIHKENSHATPTPVLQDGRLYAAFGNSGHACMDTRTGDVLWRNTELKLNHKEGPAANPILWRDLYVVTCDGTDVQYIAALNKDTGKLVWKQPRSLDLEPTAWDKRKGFSTPAVVTLGGRDCLLNLGSQRFYCNDAETGKERWILDHPGFNCPSLILVNAGVAYFASSFMQSQLIAVRLDPDATGNITHSHILWRQKRDIPKISSFLLIDGRFFLVSDQGVASWVSAGTGKQLWRAKLAGRSLASPVYAGGRIYLFDDQGQALVLDPKDEPVALARNRVEGGCRATPAVVGNALIVRSRTRLLRLEKALP
jgi:outer membrane protein assembly factor BamB